MPRSPLLAAGQQASEERFVERVRLLCVHPRQRGATDERSHAQVIELVGLGGAGCRRCRAGSAGRPVVQAEGDELRPAAHHAESLALLVLSSLGVEFMSGKQVEKLPETVVLWATAWISYFLNDLEQSHSIRHGRFQAALI